MAIDFELHLYNTLLRNVLQCCSTLSLRRVAVTFDVLQWELCQYVGVASWVAKRAHRTCIVQCVAACVSEFTAAHCSVLQRVAVHPSSKIGPSYPCNTQFVTGHTAKEVIFDLPLSFPINNIASHKSRCIYIGDLHLKCQAEPACL